MYRAGDLMLLQSPHATGICVEYLDRGYACDECEDVDHYHSHDNEGVCCVSDSRPVGATGGGLPVVQLTHSCSEWVIGGQEQIEAMIADLQAALATIRGGGK